MEILSVLFIPNPGLFCRVQHRLEGKRQLAPAGLSGAAYCRPYVLSIPALQKRAEVQNCPAKMLVFSLYGMPVLGVLALFHLALVIPFVPVNKSFTGWRELGKTVEREKATIETEKDKTTFIFGMDRYDITSELTFYMQDFEDVFSRKVLGKNALGFEFWDSRVPLPGSNAVAVDDANFFLISRCCSNISREWISK